ncbi:unnamed protein product [Symbiodinium sp. CCMP2456]|nr:unnamed protein product [Symbiodinium sp. CCMP2456]
MLRWAISLAIAVSLWSASLHRTTFSSPPGKPGAQRKPRKEAPKQRGASAFRERTGTGKGEPVPGRNYAMSASEKILTSRLRNAGRRGGSDGWKEVKRLYAGYTGVAPPVHGAAMHAAYRCGKCTEAAAMYMQVRTSGKVETNMVTLLHGLKIFGKLRDKSNVSVIWDEVLQRGWLDKFRGAARIDAAAEMGDIEDAADVLELLQNRSIPCNELHYTSAITACKNSHDNKRHVAAMYLLSEMLKSDVQPNTVTFGSLMGSHTAAPLKRIQILLAEMYKHGIQPNTLFAEESLSAIFQGQLRNAWTVDDVAERIGHFSLERLQAAHSLLEDAKSQGVPLTRLSSLAHQYLGRCL